MKVDGLKKKILKTLKKQDTQVINDLDDDGDKMNCILVALSYSVVKLVMMIMMMLSMMMMMVMMMMIIMKLT